MPPGSEVVTSTRSRTRARRDQVEHRTTRPNDGAPSAPANTDRQIRIGRSEGARSEIEDGTSAERLEPCSEWCRRARALDVGYDDQRRSPYGRDDERRVFDASSR